MNRNQKLYVLDMFPYPSGAGLHVGHPEGYTATDILCRYRRMKGFAVYIRWDGMRSGYPPSVTRCRRTFILKKQRSVTLIPSGVQIRMLGLSYDWEREVNTTDPKYYKWTQWIFLKIYNSWFDPREQKARPIKTLEQELMVHGTKNLNVEHAFTADEWKRKTKKEKHDFIAQFRLVYVAEIPVNWCEALGTVLANEEVAEWTEKGYSVERRPMRQWMMRITAYSERLLEDAKGIRLAYLNT